jgi:hypothetical protein
MFLILTTSALAACQNGTKSRVAPPHLIPPPQVLYDWSQSKYSDDPPRNAFVKDFMKQQCQLASLRGVSLPGCR